ncbi:MAG TPA: hypothetical protein VGL91_02880 [Acidobacteriota bacterium]
MKRFLRILLFAISFLAAATIFPGPDNAFAGTYYIDFVSGNDANSGTSKSSPWQHAPGMQGCVANCGVKSPQPGDSFILKGGVTWPNATMRWSWAWSGNASNRVYVGVDQTWYNSGVCGASWCRPILDGGKAAITGGGHNLFLMIAADYFTLDNIEFRGAYFSGYDYGNNAFINPQTSQYVDIKNCYFHGWANASASDSGTGILSDSHLPSLNVGMVIEYNIFDGSDTAEVQADPNCTGPCLGTLDALWYGPIVHHNIIRYVSNGYIGAAESFHDNLVEYIRRSPDVTAHENGFENNSDPCNGLLFYNNVIRHVVPGVTVWVAPQKGCAPTYVFNNVIYDTTAGNVMDIADALTNPGGSIYVLNNTIECGPDGNATYSCLNCPASYTACTLRNNHLITGNLTPILNLGASNLTTGNNVIQTQAVANGQSYVAGSNFSPTAGNGSTVLAGLNVTGLCSGNVAALCTDTTLAGTRNALPRPASGAWDAGAYQFVGAPAPPKNLRITP